MEKKYYRAVFKGKFDVICGMLEGFLLGEGAEWEWYPYRESVIESGSFSEKILELLPFSAGQHHIVLEEKFHNALQNMLKNKSDPRYRRLKYTKAAAEIKSCSFGFTAAAYAKKFGDEIKALIEAHPAGITITGYNPVEDIDDSAKGVELYSPAHDYTFKCEGTASGKFGEIFPFRKKLEEHTLIEVSNIKLKF